MPAGTLLLASHLKKPYNTIGSKKDLSIERRTRHIVNTRHQSTPPSLPRLTIPQTLTRHLHNPHRKVHWSSRHSLSQIWWRFKHRKKVERFFSCFLAFNFCRFCMFIRFSSPPQRPMTSGLRKRFKDHQKLKVLLNSFDISYQIICHSILDMTTDKIRSDFTRRITKVADL